MTEPLPVSIQAPPALPERLPAAGAARAPAGTGTTCFVALCDDAALREAIDGAVALRGRVVVTSSAHAFAETLLAQPDGIAIVDLACVPGSTAQFIERLRAQFPTLVLVAAGGARDQAALASLVADGTVCRFAHRPVSAQRLGLFLDAALRRREALAHESRAVLLAPLRPANSSAARIAVFILLLIAAAATGLWLLRRPNLPSATAVPHIEPAVSSAALAPPPATAANAAANAAATTPIITPAATPAATPASTPADAAADAAGTAGRATPAGSEPGGSDDSSAQARHEAQLARRLMDVGLLIDPPNNSARSHITLAMRLAPEDAEVRRTARALSGRLVNAARNALLAKDPTAAQRWVDAARAYGVNPATLAELDEQLTMLKGLMGQ
jgi:DNA-binding NarL/FixJ family response regulator